MNSYALNSNHFAIDHSNSPIGLLHDLNEKPTPTEIEALVASDDLFATLATELDDIALRLIQDSDANVSSRLDKLTEILLHLQRHYKIDRKSPDYRQ